MRAIIRNKWLFLSWKGVVHMNVKEFARQNNSKWLEGLILLIILGIVILLSANTKTEFKMIPDEMVSTWSGTIDNLK